ncbi:MerR family transcriptional regulator [Spirillospora sp. NPDC047279]|uniref:MerR family transcriptional regulator n=1 Tax=Spirillospora sp. NPDC047279 TaxID=3155478 RepID=UPI0033DD9724
MSEDLLPIGRFARLCRLSVKQLRHYDELGLLSPARVDPDSGYRYYRPDQARQALSIGLLRSLDVPLPDIGRTLESGTAALAGVRDRMEADLARRRTALELLERVMADGLPRSEVSVVHEPARTVVVERDAATPATIGAATSRCVARVIEALRPHSLMIGLFPLDLADEFVVGVAVEHEDGPEVLPGGPYAMATHVGPYGQISLTAHALLSWCGDHGHVPEGPLRELYLNAPTDTPPERLVTQLMIRLEDRP